MEAMCPAASLEEGTACTVYCLDTLLHHTFARNWRPENDHRQHTTPDREHDPAAAYSDVSLYVRKRNVDCGGNGHNKIDVDKTFKLHDQNWLRQFSKEGRV
jgi:hypothetical protein